MSTEEFPGEEGMGYTDDPTTIRFRDLDNQLRSKDYPTDLDSLMDTVGAIGISDGFVGGFMGFRQRVLTSEAGFETYHQARNRSAEVRATLKAEGLIQRER